MTIIEKMRCGFLAAALLGAAAAAAQGFPTRPIQLIVPFAAGGPTDVYARMIGRQLGDALGTPVVVDNRAGATGLIGSKLARDAAPDGHTLLYTTNSAHVIGPLLRTPPSFDPVADYTPLVQLLRYPTYLLTSTKVPARTFREFIALARSRPGQLSYASVGTGSGNHLACELMNRVAGIQAVHVPYKGAALAQAAVVAGEVDYMCDSVGNSQAMVAAGKMNGLALTATQRSAAVPHVPTMSEEGVPVVVHVWQGLFAPKGLPPAVRDRLVAQLTRILDTPEMKARLLRDGFESIAQSPEQFSRGIATEKAVWQKLIAEQNIKAD